VIKCEFEVCWKAALLWGHWASCGKGINHHQYSAEPYASSAAWFPQSQSSKNHMPVDTQGVLYSTNDSPKRKLRKQSHNSVKKNKTLRNKYNHGSERRIY
jgi:hypothetical protein